MPPLLTETAVKAVKPTEKARKIYDERGLFLFVPPTGARLWQMKYKVGGREKLLALGEWPHTSLKRARERRDEVRRLLADGSDPAAKKKAERQAIADTFSALAREYLDTKRSSFNPKTLSKAECPRTMGGLISKRRNARLVKLSGDSKVSPALFYHW